MKLISYEFNGKEGVGIYDARVFDVNNLGFNCKSMTDLIKNVTIEELKEAFLKNKTGGIPFEDIKLLSPIPVPDRDIICLGVNYMDHARESFKFKHKKEADGELTRKNAVYFAKRVDRCVPHGGLIDGHFDICDSLDYESELALIIGQDCKNVSEKDAYNYIFGYTIMNDVSARNLQTKHGQWYFGKSLDGFTPMGPWIVTADEFSMPLKLDVKSYINGELRQNGNTENLIFDIPYIIEELSRGMTLFAGTIISTGTPSGVGMGQNPPSFLNSKDVVECVIEGIGSLKNTVI